MFRRTRIFAFAFLFALSAARALADPPQLHHYATLPAPSADLEFDGAGFLYVSAGTKLYKVPPGGGAGVELTGSGLTAPRGLAFAPDGTLYLADYGTAGQANGRILTVNPTTGALTVFKTALREPFSIAFGPDGNLYVGLYADRKVVRIAIPGGVETDASPVLGVNGEQLMQISFDPAGNLYAGVEQDLYRVPPGGGSAVKVIDGVLHQAMGHVRWGNDNFIVSTFGFRQLYFDSPALGFYALTNTALVNHCTDGDLATPTSAATASVGQPYFMRLHAGTVYFADAQCHDIRAFDLGFITPTLATTWGRLKTIYR